MHIQFLGRARENISILVTEANPHDLVESLNAHGTGVHSQATAKVARYSFHPLKTSDARRSRQCAELFEFNSHPSCDLGSVYFMPLEISAREVGHYAWNAAIAHKKVRSPTNDHEGYVFIKAMPHEVCEAFLAFWFNPKLGGAADAHRGVL